MATINFLFRSQKDFANLTLRLLYSINGNNYVYGASTKCRVQKDFWINYYNKSHIKDIDLKNKQIELLNELNKIENYILNLFNKTKPEIINKDWLQTNIDYYYNPPQINKYYPKELVKYIEVYKEQIKNEATASTIKKCNSISQLLQRFEASTKKTILILDINSHFKVEFEDYCKTQNYAPNTIARTIKFIKTFCRHARKNGIETSINLDDIKTKTIKVENTYLTFDELAQIEKLDSRQLTDSLINAKDWLIISCYTGQRVSDFMRFTADMIRHENNKPFIEFTQVKTNKIMTIPIHPKVMELLNNRIGQFPYPISDQKYNEFIKEVCKRAGLTQKIKGSKKAETAPKSKIYRKESRIYEKWELVSSHIGRRSFATNFYGKIPTIYLKDMTGHTTEASFLTYIGKSNKDLAVELHNYFN